MRVLSGSERPLTPSCAGRRDWREFRVSRKLSPLYAHVSTDRLVSSWGLHRVVRHLFVVQADLADVANRTVAIGGPLSLLLSYIVMVRLLVRLSYRFLSEFFLLTQGVLVWAMMTVRCAASPARRRALTFARTGSVRSLVPKQGPQFLRTFPQRRDDLASPTGRRPCHARSPHGRPGFRPRVRLGVLRKLVARHASGAICRGDVDWILEQREVRFAFADSCELRQG